MPDTGVFEKWLFLSHWPTRLAADRLCQRSQKSHSKDDVQLPVGSYWLQKGGETHVTSCVSDTDCLFFIYQPGKFDYVPVQ